MSNNHKLSKKDEEYLANYRNPDGSKLTDAQREYMIGIMMTGKYLETDGKPIFKFEPEKPKPIPPSPAETTIYGNGRVQRQVRQLQAQLEAQGVQTLQPEPVDLSQYQPREVFTFIYDDFGNEVIRKVNQRFKDTKAEIPTTNLTQNQEVPNMHILKRLGVVTVISETPELRNLGVYPATPLQLEALLQGNRLPKPAGEFWEDYVLILYDHSDKGANPKEAKALHKSIEEHKEELGLRNGDLEERLLVVNPGLDVDSTFPKGVKPKIILGITKVFKHETLKQAGRDHKFSYGSENGLPSVNQLGTGNRTLYMPSSNSDLGLRVLFRYRNLNLSAWDGCLGYSNEYGRVTFAKKTA